MIYKNPSNCCSKSLVKTRETLSLQNQLEGLEIVMVAEGISLHSQSDPDKLQGGC